MEEGKRSMMQMLLPTRIARQSVFKKALRFYLPLLLIFCSFFIFIPQVHADTTLQQIVSDLGITDTTQLNLLGSDFGKVSDQLGCENDILNLVTSKKLSKDVFISCN